MIYQPSLPSGFTVYCDDIRHEVSGKITLVGAYAGEITIFGEAPLILPQLKALVVCRFPPEAHPTDVKLRVIYTREGEEDLVLLNSHINVDAGAENPGRATTSNELNNKPHSLNISQFRTLVSLNAIHVRAAGYFKTRMLMGEDEIRLGALKVILQPPVSDDVSEVS